MFKFISRLIDSEDPVIVTPFGGYANDKRLHTQARVLEDEGIEHHEDDGVFKNLYNSYKRFESDEIENAVVEVSWADQKLEFVSDAEGYIYINNDHGLELVNKESLWLPVTYTLKQGENEIFKITDAVLKPSSSAAYGIISDLDDTVINTGVASALRWRLIVNSFFTHSDKRLPLEGAQEFYKLLYRGVSGYDQNPFFYLSNSPWNLFEYLNSFLVRYDFPKGVLLLRDVGFENEKKESFLERNKFVKISHILETYPNLSFVLIGDSADIDPDIYIEIARKYKQQVKAIYIRTVTNKGRMRRVETLIEATTDVQVVLVKNTQEAIDHARANELII